MPFLNDIILSDHEVGEEVVPGRFILVEPVSYESERFKRIFTVPQGFVTDLASIPRLAQLFISKLGRHRKAAVVHDYLYNKNTSYLGVNRAQSDLIFLDAMADLKVPRWKRWTMYNAVRLFGWMGWRK